MPFWNRWLNQRDGAKRFTLPSGTVRIIPSPDSAHYACEVQDGRGMHVETDGKRLPGFERVGGITFSPDFREYNAQDESRLVCNVSQAGGKAPS
jgi:hypothetical protein